MTKTTYWVTKNDENQYLLFKTMETDSGLIGSTFRAFNTIQEAMEAKLLAEDGVAGNACSAGNVAGIGIGPQGEPGVPRGYRWPILRRRKKRRVEEDPLVRKR